jgi:hypothetical protein
LDSIAVLQTPEELKKYIDGSSLDASEVAYLRAYCEKYPDRVSSVNTIVSVYSLGSLDPLLTRLLLRNVKHVLKCSKSSDIGLIDTELKSVGSVKVDVNRLLKNVPARRANKIRKSRAGKPEPYNKSQRYSDFKELLADGQTHSVLDMMSRLDCCESSIQKWARHLRGELEPGRQLLRHADGVGLDLVSYQLVMR